MLDFAVLMLVTASSLLKLSFTLMLLLMLLLIQGTCLAYSPVLKIVSAFTVASAFFLVPNVRGSAVGFRRVMPVIVLMKRILHGVLLLRIKKGIDFIYY